MYLRWILCEVIRGGDFCVIKYRYGKNRRVIKDSNLKLV